MHQIKFPDEPEEMHAIAIGQIIYYRFLNPAIVYVFFLPLLFKTVPHLIVVQFAGRRKLSTLYPPQSVQALVET